ncbi:MAG: peptidylprolyl isomerase [Pyrinomonadaceae bacterium]|nr:peptidylprolyl isomerase [Pyrinomonadaceae bacterium]
MNIKTPLLIVIFSLFAFSSCVQNGSVSRTGNSAKSSTIQEEVKPIADDEIAIIEMENSEAFQPITIELYSNIAPKMVARFKELAREGFYNGVTFHRVNPSVIQAGDPNSKDKDPSNDGIGTSDKTDVPAEFSDLEYDRGIVGAARKGSDVNSQNSQFFITLKREPGFDKNYTVFGKVIAGMNNAKTIAGVARDGRERPLDDVVIKSITIKTKK